MRKTILVFVMLVLAGAGFHPGWATAHDEPRMTPLMEAAYRGDLAAVRALLAKGADINEKNAYGATALMMAAGAGLTDATQRATLAASAVLAIGALPHPFSGLVSDRFGRARPITIVMLCSAVCSLVPSAKG